MTEKAIDMEQLLYDAEQGYALSTEARQALAAEVRRLRKWRKDLLDEGFGYDDSEESAAEVLEWVPIWRAQDLGTETTLKYALRLLDDMADTEDCWFDHHGGCQAHGFLSLEQGETCPHQAARALLRTTPVMG